MYKVKFRNISTDELKVLVLFLQEYSHKITFKDSDIYEITAGSVAFELENKLRKLYFSQRKKHSFSLPIHQASAMFIALQSNQKYMDFYSRYVSLKIQTIIEKDFINRT